jgi:hypothetical protein
MSTWHSFGHKPGRYGPTFEQLEARTVPSATGQLLLRLANHSLTPELINFQAQTKGVIVDSGFITSQASNPMGTCDAQGAADLRQEFQDVDSSFSTFVIRFAQFGQRVHLARKQEALTSKESAQLSKALLVLHKESLEEITLLEIARGEIRNLPC